MRRLLLVVVLVMPACATGHYEPPVRYTLDPVPQVQQFEDSGLALAVRPLDVAEPFRKKVVYRDEGLKLGEYRGHEWAEPPGDLVSRALMDALRQTGRFEDVGLAIDLARPDLILTGDLRKFYIDRRDQSWTAVCEVALALRTGLDRDAVWEGVLSAEAPLASNTPTVVAPAMNAAVSEFAAQAANTIAEAAQP